MEYKVCAICFSSSPNCLGECACSYGNGPKILLNKEKLEAIYLLREDFNISVKKNKTENIYILTNE